MTVFQKGKSPTFCFTFPPTMAKTGAGKLGIRNMLCIGESEEGLCELCGTAPSQSLCLMERLDCKGCKSRTRDKRALSSPEAGLSTLADELRSVSHKYFRASLFWVLR